MVPGKYDMTIVKGGTFTLDLTAVDTNGAPIDFSVYDDIQMQIRPVWKHTPKITALMSLTLANSRISVATTTLTLTISAADTADITFDEGQYDIEMSKITGAVVDKLLYGNVTVLGEMTV